MPCNSDHMEPTDLELSLSQVKLLRNEFATGVHVDPRSDGWRGYHPGAYQQNTRKEDVDKAVADLCERVKATKRELGKKEFRKWLANCSLEFQAWWRDHCEADEQREKAEKNEHRQNKLRKKALKKLTDEECEALGIDVKD